MRRLARKSLFTQSASDDVRLNQLERRIPDDYPHMFSILLGDTGSVGPGGYNLGWTFPADCPDPSGLECEDVFVTDGDYLFFPTGFAGQYEVFMSLALGGGTADNYLEPVTPGDVAEDNVVDTSAFIISQIFIQETQEPPPYRDGGYNRLWLQYRVMAENPYITANRRWALRPFVTILAPIVTISITGLVLGVKLMPPGGTYGGSAQWSG